MSFSDRSHFFNEIAASQIDRYSDEEENENDIDQEDEAGIDREGDEYDGGGASVLYNDDLSPEAKIRQWDDHQRSRRIEAAGATSTGIIHNSANWMRTGGGNGGGVTNGLSDTSISSVNSIASSSSSNPFAVGLKASPALLAQVPFSLVQAKAKSQSNAHAAAAAKKALGSTNTGSPKLIHGGVRHQTKLPGGGGSGVKSGGGGGSGGGSGPGSGSGLNAILSVSSNGRHSLDDRSAPPPAKKRKVPTGPLVLQLFTKLQAEAQRAEANQIQSTPPVSAGSAASEQYSQSTPPNAMQHTYANLIAAPTAAAATHTTVMQPQTMVTPVLSTNVQQMQPHTTSPSTQQFPSSVSPPVTIAMQTPQPINTLPNPLQHQQHPQQPAPFSRHAAPPVPVHPSGSIPTRSIVPPASMIGTTNPGIHPHAGSTPSMPMPSNSNYINGHPVGTMQQQKDAIPQPHQQQQSQWQSKPALLSSHAGQTVKSEYPQPPSVNVAPALVANPSSLPASSNSSRPPPSVYTPPMTPTLMPAPAPHNNQIAAPEQNMQHNQQQQQQQSRLPSQQQSHPHPGPAPLRPPFPHVSAPHPVVPSPSILMPPPQYVEHHPAAPMHKPTSVITPAHATATPHRPAIPSTHTQTSGNVKQQQQQQQQQPQRPLNANPYSHTTNQLNRTGSNPSSTSVNPYQRSTSNVTFQQANPTRQPSQLHPNTHAQPTVTHLHPGPHIPPPPPPNVPTQPPPQQPQPPPPPPTSFFSDDDDDWCASDELLSVLDAAEKKHIHGTGGVGSTITVPHQPHSTPPPIAQVIQPMTHTTTTTTYTSSFVPNNVKPMNPTTITQPQHQSYGPPRVQHQTIQQPYQRPSNPHASTAVPPPAQTNPSNPPLQPGGRFPAPHPRPAVSNHAPPQVQSYPHRGPQPGPYARPQPHMHSSSNTTSHSSVNRTFTPNTVNSTVNAAVGVHASRHTPTNQTPIMQRPNMQLHQHRQQNVQVNGPPPTTFVSNRVVPPVAPPPPPPAAAPAALPMSQNIWSSSQWE